MAKANSQEKFPHRIHSGIFFVARSMLQSRDFMDRAADVLGKIVRRMNRPEAALSWLTSSWTALVGRTLAAHTRPIRCQNGCLEIVADGRGWRKQLEGMKGEFCARLNQAWGGNLIREIRFVAAKPGPKRVSHEIDNEHTPFIRRRKG
jgi:predicted nucleic acid-binding Zn ribbon protein